MDRFGRYPSDEGLVAGSAIATTISLVLVLLLAGPVPTPDFLVVLPGLPLLLPARAGAAVIGFGLVVMGIVVRGRMPGFAMGLLALAGVVTGASALGWAEAAASISLRSAPTLAWLVAYGTTFTLSTVILTAYAGSPRRRLGRWAVPVGIGLAVLAWPYAFLIWADSWISLGFAIAFAVLASARASGARERLEPRVAAHKAAAMRREARFVWIAVIGAFVVIVVSIQFPYVDSWTQGAYTPLLIPLLLAVLATRRSYFVAWSAIAASLMISIGQPLAAALNAASPQPWTDLSSFLGNPALLYLSRPPFLVSAAILLAAMASGWRALAMVGPGRATTAGWLLATGTVAIGCASLALSGEIGRFVFIGAPFPVSAVVFGPVAAGATILLRRRLVLAFIEADTGDGSVGGPFGYLMVLIAEFVTGQGRTRTAAMESERIRMASDLHAVVLPSLTQLVADSESGAAHSTMTRRLREVESEVRGLLAERRLIVLEEFGLVEALEWLLERGQERSGLQIALTVDGRSSDSRPPRAVERAAFRVAQLALDNAILHGRPGQLGVDVLVLADEVRVRVQDDGSGIQPDASGSAVRDNHQGLADMRVQADQVRARLDIVPVPAGGTVVTFGWTGA